jgi:lipid-A-disaccharide synthase-like uncharacterized protein
LFWSVGVLFWSVAILYLLVAILYSIFHFWGKTKPILAHFGGLLPFLARYWISAAEQKTAFIWGVDNIFLWRYGI